jgi:hypothetical protein
MVPITLFSEAISRRSEVCSVNISRPSTDVVDWSVHARLCENPENSKTRRIIFL